MDDLAARRANCTDTIAGNGLNRPAELLATIGDDVDPDLYGEGGVVADLEREVAELLGKQAAVFLPSGTMAQAATLRVHADTRGPRTVVWHPRAHPAQHEGEAFSRLHGLVGRAVGETTRLLTLDDLRTVAEPYAALLLELPQRDLGGQLPPFDELAAQVAFARERGAATHLDGARLWEAERRLRPAARRDRRAVRHRVRVVLQGRGRPARLLRRRHRGPDRTGQRVAQTARRHTLRPLARRRVGPADAADGARRDARAHEARPRHRRSGRRGPRHPRHTLAAADPDDAPPAFDPRAKTTPPTRNSSPKRTSCGCRRRPRPPTTRTS